MLLSSSALLPLLLALVPLVSLVFAADCRYYNADDAANANSWWYNGAPMKDLGGGVYAVDNLYSGVRVHLQVTADVNGRDSIKALHSNGFRQFKVRMLDENLNDQAIYWADTTANCQIPVIRPRNPIKHIMLLEKCNNGNCGKYAENP